MIKKIETFLEIVGELIIFVGNSFKLFFKDTFYFKRVVHHIYYDGIKSLPVILLTGIFTGGVLALQGFYALTLFSAEAFAGNMVGVTLTKELGPVLVGLMLAGRVGASYSAEIGTMKVSEQVDALFTFGINPISYLVNPRIVAMLTVTPLLVIMSDFIGIFGGRFVIDFVCHQNPLLFDRQLFLSVTMWDVFYGLIKSIFFGFIIAVVGCFYGLRTRGGAQGVGKSTTITVVISSILILISDFLASKILPFSLN